MGMEPFLLASSINVIVAQRLLRKLCVCKQVKNYTADMLAGNEGGSLTETLSRLTTENGINKGEAGYAFYEPIGCVKCGNTGYKGRMGIYEVLKIDVEVRKAILTRKSAIEIEEIAQTGGMNTLLEDGLMKAMKGETSLEEVLRVLKS